MWQELKKKYLLINVTKGSMCIETLNDTHFEIEWVIINTCQGFCPTFLSAVKTILIV